LVINSASGSQGGEVSFVTTALDDSDPIGRADARSEPARDQALLDERQMRDVVLTHFDFIWRSLRRLGVPAAAVDDAAQQVFLVASRKMADAPLPTQKSFLFAIALRVAADERRARRRHPETATLDSGADVSDSAPGPDEILERRRARSIVDRILEGLPFELRVVFVLFEVEEMTTSEIAELLAVPAGTVASRLRRARELFQQGVNRFRAAKRAGGDR
jgi:RNA polymerase sigma-70 factor (ECF subfamily)